MEVYPRARPVNLCEPAHLRRARLKHENDVWPIRVSLSLSLSVCSAHHRRGRTCATAKQLLKTIICLAGPMTSIRVALDEWAPSGEPKLHTHARKLKDYLAERAQSELANLGGITQH